MKYQVENINTFNLIYIFSNGLLFFYIQINMCLFPAGINFMSKISKKQSLKLKHTRRDTKWETASQTDKKHTPSELFPDRSLQIELNIDKNSAFLNVLISLFFLFSDVCLAPMPLGENMQLAASEPSNFAMVSPSALLRSLMLQQVYTYSATISPAIEFTLFTSTVITAIEIHTTAVVQITDILLGDQSPFQLGFVS